MIKSLEEMDNAIEKVIENAHWHSKIDTKKRIFIDPKIIKKIKDYLFFLNDLFPTEKCEQKITGELIDTFIEWGIDSRKKSAVSFKENCNPKKNMNILEALKELRSGKIIRAANEDNEIEETYFIIQFMSPFDEEFMYKINLYDCGCEDKKPTALSSLPKEDFKDVCVSFLDSENYEVVSKDEMSKEIEETWIKYHKKSEDE